MICLGLCSTLTYDMENIAQAANEVRNNEDVSWALFAYDINHIFVSATGSNYEDLIENFKDDKRFMAYVRIECGTKPMYVFLTWIGPYVSPLKKAKVSTDKAFVKDAVDFKQFNTRELLADLKSECNYNNAYRLACGT